MNDARTVTVTGERPYDVVIGRHLLGALPGLLGTDVQRVLVVHPAALATTADAVRQPVGSIPKTLIPAAISHLPTSGWTIIEGPS